MLLVADLLKEKIVSAVGNLFPSVVVSVQLEHPENPDFGDYATNVAMQLAKTMGRSPTEIAKAIVDELKSYELTFSFDNASYALLDDISVVKPGFINFKLSEVWLRSVLAEILTDKESFGASETGANKKIIVEFSNPNPNKPLHIGHSRNNFLGSSISNIFSFLGYNVIRTNYANDWGTHIAKAMLMYKKYGNNAEPNKKPDHFVGDFYAMYEKDVETKPELAQELAQLFQKLESGDTETLDLWKRIVGWTYEGWQTTYANEHIAFDVWMYQSNYKITGKDVVQLALERGVAEKDPTGAVIARLEKYGLPDKVMLRRDGTSVYATQDTQLAKDSYEKYHFDKRIYVVDNRQTDYFKQLFKILELLGFSWYDKLYHLSYGVVSLPEGQMSSRQGLVVNSDEVFGTLVTLENAEIRNSIKDVSSIEDTAKSIALAAYKYDLLKVDPKQDIVFRYDQVTKFVGNTGPYLLYTYARGSSILEKSGYDSISPDPLLVLSEYTLNKSELALLRTLYKFPEVVLSAADKLSPNEIANYVYDVAQKFNTFYASSPILSDTSQLKQFRLALVSCAMQVIKNNVQLLGIKVVERM